MDEAIDIWRDIKGYNGKYHVSYTGQVRRVYKSGKTRLLTPYKKRGKGRKVYRDRLFVKLTDDKGIGKAIMVHQIVAEHFLGEPKPGQVPYHKNGLVTDNWAINIEYIDRKKLGQLTGPKSRSKCVAKIDKYGEIVDFYSSARKAAKANYISYQTVIDRCNGKVKGAFAPDGYAYAWEDSNISMERAIKKIVMIVKE